MALDIALDPDDTGHPSRYWRITSAHLDHQNGGATIWLHGWCDEQARRDGRAPASSLTMHVRAADLPAGDLHAADTRALYAALKSGPEADRSFEYPLGVRPHLMLFGAEDC